MKQKIRIHVVISISCLFSFAGCSVYADKGDLSPDLINQIQSNYTMDAHTRAMYNAITSNNVKKLALNRDILRQHNEFFSDKVKVKGVTNQKSSGRCWLFAALNSLRPAVIDKHKFSNFEFSQNYLAFWDKMEKANTFLQYMIDRRDQDLMDREMVMILRGEPGDGGYWENFADLVNKYGAVPKEVMPETNSSESTGIMNKVLYQKLRSDAVQLHKMHRAGQSVPQLTAAKQKMLAEVYRILVMNLGEPPTQFTWRYKAKKDSDKNKDDEKEEDVEDDDDDNSEKDGTVDSDDTQQTTTTPKAFFREFVGVNLDDYVNIFNDTTKDYGKQYQIRMSRNIYDGHDITYINVSIDTLKKIAIRSIQDGAPMLFAADVSYDQSSDHGIMADGLYDYQSIYDADIKLTKAERALYRSSVRNHGMALIGVDLKENKPIKWRVENSWGSDRGSKGYWTMYDNWFDLHVYNIIVHKKYVPQAILKIKQQPPIILPPWDPML
jgi:bleomycin hydrolase